jgi:hypothetical protein
LPFYSLLLFCFSVERIDIAMSGPTSDVIIHEGISYTPLEWQEFLATNLLKKLESLIEVTKRNIEQASDPIFKEQQGAFLQLLIAQVSTVEALAAKIGKEVEDLK